MPVTYPISTSDFVGEFHISQNQNTVQDLASFLSDEKQTTWIRRIFGKELGDLIIADLDSGGVPTNPLYQAIFNPFDFENGSVLESSEGLKKILTKLFYALYVSEQPVFNQTGGNSNLQQEASSPDHLKEVVLWNRAVDDISILRCYLLQNSTDYPEYKLQYRFSYNSAI